MSRDMAILASVDVKGVSRFVPEDAEAMKDVEGEILRATTGEAQCVFAVSAAIDVVRRNATRTETLHDVDFDAGALREWRCSDHGGLDPKRAPPSGFSL